MPKIRFKRGLEAKLPTLDEGEPGFTTDTKKLFIGASDGNVELAKQTNLDTTNASVASNTSKIAEHTSTLAALPNVNANAEILSARGTFPLVGDRIASAETSLAQNVNDSLKSLYSNKYATNINSNSFPVLTANRRANKTTDREILLWGDSHSWGQGSPDEDWNGAQYSYHMAFLYSKGYYARLRKHLYEKYEFYRYGVVPFSTAGRTTFSANEISQLLPSDKKEVNENGGSINFLSGIYNQINNPLVTPVDATGFYNPTALGIAGNTYLGYLAFRKKFGQGMLVMAPERTRTTTRSNNPKEYVEIVPNGNYTTISASYTTVKYNGAIIYGYVTTDKSLQFIHTAEEVYPDWLDINQFLYIPGYGEVKVTTFTKVTGTGGITIGIKKTDGTEITDDLSPYFYAGVKIYRSHVGKATFYVDMKQHARKCYVGALAGPNSAKLEMYFLDENQGLTNFDMLGATKGESSGKGNRSNIYYASPSGYPKVYKVVNGGFTELVSPEVTVGSGSITIDTYATTNKEVVYCIDWGMKQKGRLFFNYAGANASATAMSVPAGYTSFGVPILMIRGILFDGNDVRNFAMGGHTVGQWLGDGTPSYNDATYNHVDEILNFVPFTPTLSVIQAPIVNEYLRQTPIETFKTNLNTLITKLNNHLNSGGTRKMDVLVFTTVGHKDVLFQSATSSPITYGQYVQAVKDVCTANNYGFIDFMQFFSDAVQKNILDYEMIYDDNMHPSPFANEFIARELEQAIDWIM
jgi:lysophospholipase L1-like esterase